MNPFNGGWQSALLATCLLFLVVLAMVLAAQHWHNRTFRRIPKRRIDRSYSTGQFNVPKQIIGGRGLRS